jgi:pimeloyl-ACP methyl ester carboxylesterase
LSGIAFKTLGGEGQDVVLIHGFGSDRLSWLGNSPAFLPFAKVHALDLPGHGDSDVSNLGDGSPQHLAQAVANALSEQGIERAHFIGHSLGGALSCLIAAAHPQRVASLSLIAPAGLGGRLDPDFPLTYPSTTEPDAMLALLQRLVTKPILINRMTVQRALAQLDRPGIREAQKLIGAQLVKHEADLTAASLSASRLGIPRLVIWGMGDSLNTFDEQRLGQFGGEVLNIPAAGHLPHIENARQVNESLAAFLQRHAAA